MIEICKLIHLDDLLWLPATVDQTVLIHCGAAHNRSPLVLSMWCRPHRRNVHWLKRCRPLQVTSIIQRLRSIPRRH